MNRVLAAAFLLVLAGASMSAAAIPEFRYQSPLHVGGGWISFYLPNVSQGTEVGIGADGGRPSLSGVYAFDTNGSLITAVYGNRGGSSREMTVVDQTSGTRVVPMREQARASGVYLIASAGLPASDGLFVAAWSAGEDPVWFLEIYSPTPIEMSRVTEGDTSYYMREHEWGGTAAFAHAQGATLSAGLRASRDLQVNGHFLGSYGRQPLGVSAGLLTMEGPLGARMCPCEIIDLYGPDAAPAGAYRFTHDGASARVGGALLSGADVVIDGLPVR